MAAKEIAVKKYVVRLSPDERCQLNDLIRARADDPGEGSRSRSSSYGGEPQQSRQLNSGPGRSCGRAAALRARFGDPGEGSRA